MQPSSPLTSQHSSSRWDILWYLLAGYVGYVALMTLFLATLTISQTVGWLLQAISQVIFLGGATWLLGERRGRFTWAELGLWPPRRPRRWLWWMVGLGLAGAVFNLLSERVAYWLQQGTFGNLGASTDQPWGDLAIIWLATGLLIPLAEEIFFRGAIYTWFEQIYGSGAALIGSATLFAITRATFFSSSSPLHVIQSLVLGFVLAYVMRRTHALWLPIGIHILTYTLALGITILAAVF